MKNPINVCRRLLKNAWLDFRYGGQFLGGGIDSKYADHGAYETANSDYDTLKILFKDIDISDTDVLVDVGCGKGRVINYWLSSGIKNRIYGIELDPDVAGDTQERLKNYANITIIAGSCIDNFPVEGTIFYLYNPFSESVLKEFLASVNRLCTTDGRIIIIYNNPRHITVFNDYADWRISYFDIDENAELKRIRSKSSNVHSYAVITVPKKE